MNINNMFSSWKRPDTRNKIVLTYLFFKIWIENGEYVYLLDAINDMNFDL